VNLTIIAAAKFEVEPLKNVLEQLGFTPEVHVVGIGALNAAKNARPIAESCRGKNVVFVGTCGSFGPFSKPYLVTGKDVHWLPTSDRLGFSYTIKDTAPAIPLKKRGDLVQGIPEKTILCGPSISTIGTLPEQYIADSCVENLELYSCAAEISAKAAEFSVVLCVTNTVGPDSHSQWKEHFLGAATETAEFFKNAIFTRKK
jgi:hypothetical protein